MNELTIHSNIHPYKVSFESDFTFISKLIEDPQAIFIIDRNVYHAYEAQFSECNSHRVLLLDALEVNKNIEYVMSIFKFLMALDSKKNTHLVSIGGGVIQDISGFAASTLYRGINWTFIPTTLLAQADSCVGSKTSLNFEQYKNILGSFYPPHQIHICSKFISSLSDDDIHSGCGEIIKFMLLDDRKTIDFEYIKITMKNALITKDFLPAIEESLGVKQSYIRQDEFDTGKRNLFNYGHCFGHALESSSKFRIPHGVAVIYGMIFANIIACHRGLVSSNACNNWFESLFKPYLSVIPTLNELNETQIINALKNDKKRIGQYLTMIIPSTEAIDAIKVNDLTQDEVIKALNVFKQEISI